MGTKDPIRPTLIVKSWGSTRPTYLSSYLDLDDLRFCSFWKNLKVSFCAFDEFYILVGQNFSRETRLTNHFRNAVYFLLVGSLKFFGQGPKMVANVTQLGSN